MTERSTLMLCLIALYLGSSIPEKAGEGVFYAILGLGWAVYLVWTVAAWRRGEKIFIWQE